jgi:hypothetical protein
MSDHSKQLLISILDLASVLVFLVALAIGIVLHIDFHSTTSIGITLMTVLFVLSSYLSFLWKITRFPELSQLLKS